jgi:GNAT superfamily N-acetyltransferase
MKLADPLEVPTYSVISYAAHKLPEEYVSLIFSKWLRSLRFGNPLFKNIKSEAFYTQYHAYIENLLKKPDSIVRLAVLTDDPDVVLGFSVCREDVLDYVYVHKDHRNVGIAKSLMPKNRKITTMTHITMIALEIWRKNPKYKYLEFNPFA